MGVDVSAKPVELVVDGDQREFFLALEEGVLELGSLRRFEVS